MPEVLCRRPAMATLFEFLLVGDDAEHLEAVGEAALDEVTRIEQMLSMFDPASELSRVNREAYAKPVTVSQDLFNILEDCQEYHERTLGYFDPCHGGPLPYANAVILEASVNRVRFAHPQSRIDLGGFGKGYALDTAQLVLFENSVGHHILHGGTSSVLARGAEPRAVDLRSPDGRTILGQVRLLGDSLSSSANDTLGTAVIAKAAELSEVWSTAMLAAGRERMDKLDYHCVEAAAWLDTEIHWIVGEP
jgi:FAD:protein FMN transferase